MRLHLLHETRYDYLPAVREARHVTCLQPRDGTHQRVLAHRLRITPEPAQREWRTDAFGNRRCSFGLQQQHEQLRLVAESLVDTRPPAPVDTSPPWEAVRDRLRYRRGTPYEPAAEFVHGSALAPHHGDFIDYARGCFAAGQPLHASAQALMHRIHSDFAYAPQTTEVHTPALDALRIQRGVCQDFAHVLVACLRSLGLAARYVSGYLLTEPPPGQPRLVGADASHAWASVWLPGAEPSQGHWLDLDPTNDRAAGEDYITLALGRDYADVAPVRGVIHGGARHTLAVAVTVQPSSVDSLESDS